MRLLTGQDIRVTLSSLGSIPNKVSSARGYAGVNNLCFYGTVIKSWWRGYFLPFFSSVTMQLHSIPFQILAVAYRACARRQKCCPRIVPPLLYLSAIFPSDHHLTFCLLASTQQVAVSDYAWAANEPNSDAGVRKCDKTHGRCRW